MNTRYIEDIRSPPCMHSFHSLFMDMLLNSFTKFVHKMTVVYIYVMCNEVVHAVYNNIPKSMLVSCVAYTQTAKSKRQKLCEYILHSFVLRLI